MGAVAIKNSVYVAPKTDDTQEDFEWLLREIVKGGGDASICEARFIEGLEDDGVEALFNVARESDYRQIADEARAIAERGVTVRWTAGSSRRRYMMRSQWRVAEG